MTPEQHKLVTLLREACASAADRRGWAVQVERRDVEALDAALAELAALDHLRAYLRVATSDSADAQDAAAAAAALLTEDDARLLAAFCKAAVGHALTALRAAAEP
jgi:hypothetical protein